MNAFTRHNQTVPLSGIITPRKVEVMPVRVNPAILGNKADRDAYLDQLIADEEAAKREHNLSAESEIHTEGRIHRNTRVQRHE